MTRTVQAASRLTPNLTLALALALALAQALALTLTLTLTPNPMQVTCNSSAATGKSTSTSTSGPQSIPQVPLSDPIFDDEDATFDEEASRIVV